MAGNGVSQAMDFTPFLISAVRDKHPHARSGNAASRQMADGNRTLV